MSNLNPKHIASNLPADINKEILNFLDIDELAVLFAVGSNAKLVCLNGLFNLGDTTLKLIKERCKTGSYYDKTKQQSISHNGKWNRRKVLVAICSANYGADFRPSPFLLWRIFKVCKCRNRYMSALTEAVKAGNHYIVYQLMEQQLFRSQRYDVKQVIYDVSYAALRAGHKKCVNVLTKYAKETVVKAVLCNSSTEDPNHSILYYWLLLPKELQKTCPVRMEDICQYMGWNGVGMQRLMPFLKWILCNRPDIVESLRKHRTKYPYYTNVATLIYNTYTNITQETIDFLIFDDNGFKLPLYSEECKDRVIWSIIHSDNIFTSFEGEWFFKAMIALKDNIDYHEWFLVALKLIQSEKWDLLDRFFIRQIRFYKDLKDQFPATLPLFTKRTTMGHFVPDDFQRFYQLVQNKKEYPTAAMIKLVDLIVEHIGVELLKESDIVNRYIDWFKYKDYRNSLHPSKVAFVEHLFHATNTPMQ